jgi:hypothetical protein
MAGWLAVKRRRRVAAAIMSGYRRRRRWRKLIGENKPESESGVAMAGGNEEENEKAQSWRRKANGVMKINEMAPIIEQWPMAKMSAEKK